jgi:hypothetical protein
VWWVNTILKLACPIAIAIFHENFVFGIATLFATVALVESNPAIDATETHFSK